MHPMALAGLLALLAAPPPAPDAGLFPAELVADLAAQTSPHLNEEYLLPAFVEANGIVYFFQDDGMHGRELWRSDGTALGTYLVRDVCPGVCGVEPRGFFGDLAAMGGSILFAASDGVHGTELWVSDGSALGTQLVADLFPGAISSRPMSFLVASGQLFFSADDGVHGYELWRSDGTAAGTRLVADITPGPGGSQPEPFGDGNGVLYLAVGRRLWRSDGTALGTFQLGTVTVWQATQFRGMPFAVLPNGKLLFWGATTPTDSELWISDGTTAGTQQLVDLVPGSEGSEPRSFELAGSELFFTARASADPARSGLALWRSDGTAAGTQEIPLPAAVNPSGWPSSLAWAGGRLFFSGSDSAHGSEPWVVDTGGPRLVRDVNPGPEGSLAVNSFYGASYLLASVGTRLVFLADDGVHGLELWSSDATEAGTVRLSDFGPGTAYPHLDAFSGYATSGVFGDRFFFRRWAAADGHSLWTSDGTAAGTGPVLAMDRESSAFFPTAGTQTLPMIFGVDCRAAAGGRLVFAAETDNRSRLSLWGTDGSAGGTEELVPLTAAGSRLSPSCCTTGTTALLRGYTADQVGLYASDGTLAGTQLLAPLGPVWVGNEPGQPLLVPLGSRWVGSQEGDPDSKWIESDLTPAGTSVTSVGLSAGELVPKDAGVLGFRPGLILSIDGTAASLETLLPADGVPLGWPDEPTPVGELRLFIGYREATGAELWRTDGTSPGTMPVLDLNPGPGSAFSSDSGPWDNAGFPRRLVSLDTLAVMAVDDGLHGTELWRTDGTPEGTTLLKDIYPGSYPSTPRDLVRVGDVVYFAAEDELHGLELWVTDGTSEGTRLVRDLVPGAESSVPQELTEVRGRLYFTAWRPAWGREAFQTDGTEAGTLQVSDVWPGTGSSSPSRFAAVRDTLYFAANDGEHGFELFKVTDATLLDLFADGFEGGALDAWSRRTGP